MVSACSGFVFAAVTLLTGCKSARNFDSSIDACQSDDFATTSTLLSLSSPMMLPLPIVSVVADYSTKRDVTIDVHSSCRCLRRSLIKPTTSLFAHIIVNGATGQRRRDTNDKYCVVHVYSGCIGDDKMYC
jgi:hypothetical protein